MRSTLKSQLGFTLLELMFTVAVLAILIALAVPSFIEFRARSAVRGAVEQLTSVFTMAKLEAVKQDRLVKVGFVRAADGTMCIGTALANSSSDDTHCDCFTAGSCNIAQYPATQQEWRGAKWVTDPTMGNNGTAGAGVVVIDPKLGLLTETADSGAITMQAKNDDFDYRLQFDVSVLGRTSVCVPAGSPSLPGYRSC